MSQMSDGVAALSILIIIVLVLGYFYFKHRMKRKALRERYGHIPSHEELYFEEYFDEMIKNWDLLKKEEVKKWVESMDKRLDTVSNDIDRLNTKRTDIDANFEKIEESLKRLEEEVSR